VGYFPREAVSGLNDLDDTATGSAVSLFLNSLSFLLTSISGSCAQRFARQEEEAADFIHQHVRRVARQGSASGVRGYLPQSAVSVDHDGGGGCVVLALLFLPFLSCVVVCIRLLASWLRVWKVTEIFGNIETIITEAKNTLALFSRKVGSGGVLAFSGLAHHQAGAHRGAYWRHLPQGETATIFVVVLVLYCQLCGSHFCALLCL
jgi:hypothetical protein